MAATEYIVLEQTGAETTGEAWEIVGAYTAGTSDAAIREAALAHGDGTYVATPARSWQPTAMKVQPRAVAVKP